MEYPQEYFQTQNKSNKRKFDEMFSNSVHEIVVIFPVLVVVKANVTQDIRPQMPKAMKRTIIRISHHPPSLLNMSSNDLILRDLFAS